MNGKHGNALLIQAAIFLLIHYCKVKQEASASVASEEDRHDNQYRRSGDRREDSGESDRLVTLLTREEGILRAFAPKAKKLKDSKMSSTQLLSYSNFVLYKGKRKIRHQ